MGGMDAFGGLLDGPRARGAFALRTVMTPPWSLRILAESPITVLAMVKGHAWVIPDRGDTPVATTTRSAGTILSPARRSASILSPARWTAATP